jgi:hypothetical protein
MSSGISLGSSIALQAVALPFMGKNSNLKFIRSYKAGLILLNERLLTRNGIDFGPRLAVIEDLQAIPLLLLSVDFT